MTGRDSRTNEQRAADDQAEREFFAEHPDVNWGATITLSLRDVTDLEASALAVAISGSAAAIVSGGTVDTEEAPRTVRPPSLAGWTYSTEPYIDTALLPPDEFERRMLGNDEHGKPTR